MPTTPPEDSAPRQQAGAVTRLMLSASAASDPARFKRIIERWRDGTGVMSSLAPRSPGHPNPTASERERGSTLPWTPLHLFRPPAAVADIDHLGRVIERVRQRLGCPHCCSGFDIDFQRELDAFPPSSEREPGRSDP
jgi:hypothetical protein